jgi:predicted amidohydrolase
MGTSYHVGAVLLGRCRAVVSALGIALLAFAATPFGWAASAASPQPDGMPAPSRSDGLPRKVLLGTMICGDELFTMPLESRLGRMDKLMAEVADEAKAKYPGKRLDLVILPEFFLARPGDRMPQEAVLLDDVRPRIADCARRYGCYMVVPLLMRETGVPPRYSNAAVLVDRSGGVVGIYRKVHPVAPQGTEDLEGGTTPGPGFPVFDCDFGRIGIQICFDMLYPDGWQSLARQGAEIVALPSASPETAHPTFYALKHEYYVISATPRDHAAVYSPLGLIEAQVTKESVLVHEIDLSYAILHWEAVLDEGEALKRRFGDRVGYHYYHEEDNGIFWSNDPGMTIGQMIRSLDIVDSKSNAERVRRLQDKVRGGPPAAP